MRRRMWALTLLIAVACATQTDGSNGYTLNEWAIDGPERLLASDTISITVENAGEYRHTLVATTDAGEVVGATGVVDPGEATVLELDLESGTYTFSCRIVAEDDAGNLSDHYERGMYRTITVTD